MHADEPLIWQRVEWRHGDGRYVFEVAQGGLHATLSSPHGHTLTLPMIAWEGLLDALAAARKSKARGERAGMPARAGARWTPAEIDELRAAYSAGATIAALAQAHNRSAYAIETKLADLGLWDRHLGVPNQRGAQPPRPMIPPDWPPDPPPHALPPRRA